MLDGLAEFRVREVPWDLVAGPDGWALTPTAQSALLAPVHRNG